MDKAIREFSEKLELKEIELERRRKPAVDNEKITDLVDELFAKEEKIIDKSLSG